MKCTTFRKAKTPCSLSYVAPRLTYAYTYMHWYGGGIDDETRQGIMRDLEGEGTKKPRHGNGGSGPAGDTQVVGRVERRRIKMKKEMRKKMS